MTEDDFLIAFETGRLLPHEFDHRAHLQAAWLMLRRWPLEEAIAKTCRAIEALAIRFGARAKFHRTLSEALMRLMYAASVRRPSSSFDEYLRINEWLLRDVRAVLAEYYSAARLHSAQARECFVPPDLKPLP